MKRPQAKAITFTEFHKGSFRGKPPEHRETLLDRMAEAFLQVTGLKKIARARLTSDLFAAQSETYVQNLQLMFNEVVDGGVRGLKTAIKVCFCFKK